MFRYLKKTNCLQHNQEAGKSYAVYGVLSKYNSVTWTVDVQRDYQGKIILVSLYARVDKPGAGAELRHMYHPYFDEMRKEIMNMKFKRMKEN